MQIEGVVVVAPEHYQPGKGPEQSALHPKLSALFPSSQNSPGMTYPSPQIPEQNEVFPINVQVQPVSHVQLGEHPPPPTKFPGSHCSAIVTTPSPHY